MKPECVAFDSWYAELENLQHICRLEWRFLTRLKSNRVVNPDKSGHIDAQAPDQRVDRTIFVWILMFLRKFSDDLDVLQNLHSYTENSCFPCSHASGLRKTLHWLGLYGDFGICNSL